MGILSSFKSWWKRTNSSSDEKSREAEAKTNSEASQQQRLSDDATDEGMPEAPEHTEEHWPGEEGTPGTGDQGVAARSRLVPLRARRRSTFLRL